MSLVGRSPRAFVKAKIHIVYHKPSHKYLFASLSESSGQVQVNASYPEIPLKNSKNYSTWSSLINDSTYEILLTPLWSTSLKHLRTWLEISRYPYGPDKNSRKVVVEVAQILKRKTGDPRVLGLLERFQPHAMLK